MHWGTFVDLLELSIDGGCKTALRTINRQAIQHKGYAG